MHEKEKEQGRDFLGRKKNRLSDFFADINKKVNEICILQKFVYLKRGYSGILCRSEFDQIQPEIDLLLLLFSCIKV